MPKPNQELRDDIDELFNSISLEIKTDITNHITGDCSRDSFITFQQFRKHVLALKAKWQTEARIDENDHHWHHQKHITEQSKNGLVSKYFLDRISQLEAQKKELV